MTPPYLIGLDLGQVADSTALAIAKRRFERWGDIQEQHYDIGHLERFPLGTPYGGRCLHHTIYKHPCRACPQGVSIGGIVEQVRHRLLHLPLPDSWYRRVPPPINGGVPFPNQEKPFEWLIDYTGVGRGVADMFISREDWPICVAVTAGNAVTEPEPGIWHVAKRQLMSPMQVVLQTRRLHVPKNEMGIVLQQEAVNFKFRLNDKAGAEEQYATWRENKHDDVLFAVALLVWHGERTAPLFAGSGGQQLHAVSEWHPTIAGGVR